MSILVLTSWPKKIFVWKTAKFFLVDKLKIYIFTITYIQGLKIILEYNQNCKNRQRNFISIPIINVPTNKEHECLDSSERKPI